MRGQGELGGIGRMGLKGRIGPIRLIMLMRLMVALTVSADERIIGSQRESNFSGLH